MSDESTPVDFRDLLEAVIDGVASPEEKRKLALIIKSDPAARKQYIQHCEMHAALAWQHGVLDQLPFPGQFDESESNPGAKNVIPFPIHRALKIVALAACIALVGFFVYQGVLPSLERKAWLSSKSVGSIDRYSGGQLVVSGTNIAIDQGEILRAGEYSLAKGLAAFTLSNKVEVLLEAPAHFEIVSHDLIHLHEGKLSAHVPPEGIGFTIDTPHAQVVDHGTVFAIEVAGERQSEVHVFSGEVEVKPHDAPPEESSLTLTTSQATRIQSGITAPFGIELDPERFLRSLDEPPLRYFKQIRKEAPIAYYRMAVSEDGKTLLDRAPTESPKHGIIHQQSEHGSPFCTGRFGAGLRFKGGAERTYAIVEDCPGSLNNEFTVTAWVYATSRARSATIAKTKDETGSGQFMLGLFRDHGGLEARLPNGNGTTLHLSDSTPMPLREWQHIALVVDGNLARLYRNGHIVAEEPYTKTKKLASQVLSIGAFLNRDEAGNFEPSRFWDGKIDELSIHDIAFPPEQILTLASSPQ
ncbi:LamG-like jellyroll fold domain-containing protein [Pelagicoccus mobilis]|uniref:FecR domain-containing protein n=1 Tax=Pelagicoccus mobilis TaxID=415221 RepID=A0A934VR41_9BACT|nr:LamG-like jellyroll fold domain-containing protein [Pelagicoccus mobilis]MBK1879007.1 FecR domain-containing protein [Pelagicoccus mobilis]